MNQEEEDIARVEKYLQGATHGTELEEMEGRMASEPAFKKLVEDLKALKQGVRESARSDLKATLVQIEATVRTKEQHRGNLRWSLGIAAGILLFASFYVFWPTGDPGGMPLFAEVFESYPNIVMPLERGSLPDSNDLAMAYREYEFGKYSDAIVLFEGHEPKDAATHFYLGVCYLANAEPAKARLNFENKALQVDTTFTEQVEWYMALSFILDRDNVGATGRLESIASREGAYAEKARNLLKLLKPVE